MTIQPNKWKVILSLIPVYSSLFILPVALNWYGNSATSSYVLLEGIGLLVYSIFTVLVLPFTWLFKATGLASDFGVLPEITLPGLILLALIYSALIYFLISLLQWKKKG